MTEEESCALAIAACNEMIGITAQCETRVARFLGYYVEGEGEEPSVGERLEAIFNPALNGTNRHLKRLRLALEHWMPHTLPSAVSEALGRLSNVATAFVERMEDFKRIPSFSVSFTCELDIFRYMTSEPVGVETFDDHRRQLKSKFKAMKESFYANAAALYDVTSEIIRLSPYRSAPKPRSFESIMAKFKAVSQKPSSAAVSPRTARPVTLEMAVDFLSGVCAKENLADFSVGRRTFMRWERGETQPVAGYTPSCRDSLQGFLAWAQGYVVHCRAHAAQKRARVTFDDRYRQK